MIFYRQLCLEMYDDNLDTYIRTEAIEPDFQWTLLQDLCCQLVDSMTWLHQNNIHYDGRLHPRNIFVKNGRYGFCVSLLPFVYTRLTRIISFHFAGLLYHVWSV